MLFGPRLWFLEGVEAVTFALAGILCLFGFTRSIILMVNKKIHPANCAFVLLVEIGLFFFYFILVVVMVVILLEAAGIYTGMSVIEGQPISAEAIYEASLFITVSLLLLFIYFLYLVYLIIKSLVKKNKKKTEIKR